MPYEDGQTTIFLYTKGKYAPSQDLSDMLRYIENSREENASNPSLKRMSDMVRETGAARGETAAKIREKYALSQEETEQYMKTFWDK